MEAAFGKLQSCMNRMNSRSQQLPLLISLGLIGITVAAFCPVLDAGFVSYDDPLYVPLNPFVTSGLTWQGIKWAFTTSYGQNWFPLTWLSHMLDVQLFGVTASSHHFTNLALHVTNTLLLFTFLRKMTSTIWRSALVAALFAVHPLHVESVAWIAERKDVLSGFFFLLTLLFYSRYAAGFHGQEAAHPKGFSTQNPRVCYGVSLLMFAFGLMSKPMLVTVPFLLLLLDLWPLKRIPLAAFSTENNPVETSLGTAVSLQGSKKSAWRTTLCPLIEEKIPFCLLTLASCLITMRVQTQAMIDPNALPLVARLQNALLAYGAYLRQTFWPRHLAVFYPYETTFPIIAVLGVLAVILIVTLLCLRFVKRIPWALVGWFWFLGMLVPTIGLVQVGSQARADRYTYLPLIGIFLMITWGLELLLRPRLDNVEKATAPEGKRRQIYAVLVGTVACVVLGELSWATHKQGGYWHDTDSLFRHAAVAVPENYVAWNGIAIGEMRAGDYDGAIRDLNVAMKYGESHGAAAGIKYYLGWALFHAGKTEEALKALQECKPLPEQRGERNYWLGLCLAKLGRGDEAVKALKGAVSAQPMSLDYRFALAGLLQQQGDFNGAVEVLRSVVKRAPKMPLAQQRLAEALAKSGRFQEAAAQYATACELTPSDPNLFEGYADSLAHAGKKPEAVEQLRKAIALAPNNPTLPYKLAQVYADSGDTAMAFREYDNSLASDPNFVPALNDLAWILATDPSSTNRNGSRAVELAQRACEQTKWNEALLIGTLAAAYAEAGQFDKAVDTAQKARDVASANKQEDVAKRNQELLAVYRSGKAFRDLPAQSASK